jgi:hypothetical protein
MAMRITLAATIAACLILSTVFPTNVEVETSENWAVRRSIVAEALEFRGTPYVSAGTSREGVDCSGLVYRVFKNVTGEALSRRVKSLISEGSRVYGEPQPGDLVFFDTTGGPSHVGISIGGREFVHAASEGRQTGVIVSSLDKHYYKTRYLGARRVIDVALAVVRIDVDDNKASSELTAPMASGQPVRFAITNALPQARKFTFRVFHDGRFAFSKSIRFETEHEAEESLIWFVPTAGRWTVLLDELGSGEPAALIEFQVGESR